MPSFFKPFSFCRLNPITSNKTFVRGIKGALRRRPKFHSTNNNDIIHNFSTLLRKSKIELFLLSAKYSVHKIPFPVIQYRLTEHVFQLLYRYRTCLSSITQIIRTPGQNMTTYCSTIIYCSTSIWPGSEEELP